MNDPAVRRSLRYTLLLAAGLVLAACSERETAEPPRETRAADDAPDRRADTVFINGSVYTVDGRRGWASGVAIAGGRIVYVGTDQGARERAGEGTRIIDLGRRMMLPGFQDVHIHPISGGIEAAACDLNDLDTLEEYLAAIERYAGENPDEEWILGGGWSMSVFGPGANASRELLDEIVPDRPVYLTSADGHSAWVNSKALEIAGITADTGNPADGVIDRGPQGEPLGSLHEGAMYLVSRHTPEVNLETRTAGLRYAVDMLNEYGITSIQDASVDRDSLETYRALDERGELTLRVVGAQWWDRQRGPEQIPELEELRREYDGGRIRAGTVKIMQDGVMENFTAVMLEPYLGTDTRGIPMVPPEALKRAVTELDARGFQVHFHAIGDGAIRQSLDAIEAALRANGDNDNRHHISHLEVIHPNDMPRFRRLGAVANFQPLWAYADSYITDLTIPFIGPERSRWLYPIASVHRRGGMIAFGSDWSVSTANPFHQIETAVTRMGAEGDTTEPFLPEQRIELPLALAAFTINAAYVNHSEADTGSIEAGKYADLIVLDRNLFDIPPEEISQTKVLLTMLEGEVVYGDLNTL